MSQIAGVLQILVGLAFISIPIVRHRYGPDAQVAADAELARQGVSGPVMTKHKVNVDASGIETALPAVIAAAMFVTAGFNFAGASIGEVLTWIFQPLVILINALFVYSQMTAEKSVSAFFAKTGEPELQGLDVKAFLRASESGFPQWVMPGLQNVGNVIVFVGSAVALILIAVN